MSFPVYSNYETQRDASIPHLERLPAHWGIKRLKYLSAMKSDKLPSKGSALPYVGMENVESWSGRIVDGSSEVEGFATAFGRNDVLFGKLRPYLAKVTKPEFDGLCSSEFLVFEAAKSFSADFLAYCLRSADLIGVVNGSTYGAKMPRANPNFVVNLELPEPPAQEQTAIANFLKEKCAKIDEAVRIKEEQIKLLRERRQILIQQAVTRGLDPDAPMKDSGIDWIGEIPTHWAVRRGKFLFREVDDRSALGAEELLSVSHTTGVTARSEKNVNMFMAEDYSGSKLCRPGDVVINTMWAWMGALGVSELFGIVSPSYGVYRPTGRDLFNNRYLEWLLRTTPFIEQYNKLSTGLHSSRLRLYPHMFLGMYLACPGRQEQDSIVEVVELASEKIDRAIETKAQQIATLNEYKTTLINAAVTGKIKVC